MTGVDIDVCLTVDPRVAELKKNSENLLLQVEKILKIYFCKRTLEQKIRDFVGHNFVKK